MVWGSMICPNCSAQMEERDIQGVYLDICPNCGGTWFQADELKKLLDADPQSLNSIEAITECHVEHARSVASTMSCPEDGTQLHEFHYLYDTPVILHTCDTCGGFWVAEGEVGRMLQYHDQANAPLTAKEKSVAEFAQAITEHDREMHKIEGWMRFFGFLRRSGPGWVGLWP